jgi:hypothetical protein
VEPVLLRAATILRTGAANSSAPNTRAPPARLDLVPPALGPRRAPEAPRCHAPRRAPLRADRAVPCASPPWPACTPSRNGGQLAEACTARARCVRGRAARGEPVAAGSAQARARGVEGGAGWHTLGRARAGVSPTPGRGMFGARCRGMRPMCGAPARRTMVGVMTHTTSQFELSVPLTYIETTIPSGMTIDEYRRSRPQRRSRWHRLWHWTPGS